MLVVDLKSTGAEHAETARPLRSPKRSTRRSSRSRADRRCGWKSGLPAERLLRLQRLFGYTREDVKMILQPMALEGKDAVWSMGDDTPLASLARSPRPVYAYFRQRFAQVTNPPIDPLREACVVSLHTRLGPWPHLLDKNARSPASRSPRPSSRSARSRPCARASTRSLTSCPLAELDCVFPPGNPLRRARRLCAQAIALVRGGAQLLLLTDLPAGPGEAAHPDGHGNGAVHQALVDAGLRTRVGLAVEAGDCRDIHHAAVLIGYGAGAVCPWLALETGRALPPRTNGREEDAQGPR